MDDADVVIGVIDGTCSLHDEDMVVLEKIMNKKAIIAVNKSDLPTAESLEIQIRPYSENILKISARTGAGLDMLKEKILDMSVTGDQKAGLGSAFDEGAGVIVTNIRHKVAVDNAVSYLNNGASALAASVPLELVAVEMRDALDRLGEIVGAVTTDDILNRIFSEFCIGK
jgi:tRNA modification GTPase